VTVRNPSPEAVRGVNLDLVWNALAEGGAELARLPQAFPEVVV